MRQQQGRYRCNAQLEKITSLCWIHLASRRANQVRVPCSWKPL
jgi:hypothetical protein